MSTAPLNDSNKVNRVEERFEPSTNPLCFLSLLAEASLEHMHDAKRAKVCAPFLPGSSLECGEVIECGGEGRATELASLDNTARPRCPSRHSADAMTSSSRSTSPLSGPGANGKSYQCNRCARVYASTDAVRKHARQNHPEWLKEQGTGCPSLYCTAVEASDAASAKTTKSLVTPPPACIAHLAAAVSMPPSSAAVVAAPVAAPLLLNPAYAAAPMMLPKLTVTAPTSALPPPEPSPADPTAAQLLTGLMTAAAYDDEEDYEDDEYAARADRLAALMAFTPDRWSASMPPPPLRGGAAVAARGGTGNKRPRSVRCGNCDGCVRDDCGSCKNCVDKPKFGGIGMRKQGCVRKICSAPRTAV